MHVESWSASVCVSSSLFYVQPRVFFVVSFAFIPRTNLAMNFVRPFKYKSPGFSCNDCVVKSRKEIENKQSRFRDLTAARQPQKISCSRSPFGMVFAFKSWTNFLDNFGDTSRNGILCTLTTAADAGTFSAPATYRKSDSSCSSRSGTASMNAPRKMNYEPSSTGNGPSSPNRAAAMRTDPCARFDQTT